ncbi:hypothetical protein AVEN_274928-1, partial [Araneus ventricosus]
VKITNDLHIQEKRITSPGYVSQESIMNVTRLSRSYQGEFTPEATYNKFTMRVTIRTMRVQQIVTTQGEL